MDTPTATSQGWVKLHRKLLDNRVLKYDHSAMLVFVTLLLLVRHNDGTYDTGRFRLAEIVGMKPSTVYKILKRLEKADMISLSSNSKYTLISISNWANYQGNGNSTVTARGQHGNTEQERRIKNKEKHKGFSFNNKELETAFDEFGLMRKTIKKPLED